LQAIQTHILTSDKKNDWEYHIPYLIKGALNEHPGSAMARMDSERKDDFVAL